MLPRRVKIGRATGEARGQGVGSDAPPVIVAHVNFSPPTPTGSRSLQELDIGLRLYLKAQGRSVENNSIKSKGTAGLSSKMNQAKTCQRLPWLEAPALGERPGGEGEMGQASPAPPFCPRPWPRHTNILTNTLPLILKPLWIAREI